MKSKILILFFCIVNLVMAQRKEVTLYSDISNIQPGQIVDVYTSKNDSFVVPVKELFTLTWNDEFDIEPIEVSTTHVRFKVYGVLKGTNKLYIDVDDGPFGIIYFSYIGQTDKDSLSNPNDADPDTQNGDYGDIGLNPNPNDNSITVSNPSGGHKNISNLPCHNFHVIDGIFTKFEDSNINEWEGITALEGKFSRLYLDYCDSTMYLMNDWFIAEGEQHSTCYNQFEFYTGGGAEHWFIKIPEDKSKRTKVIRNGSDVSLDSNIVIGGEAGFGKSIISTFDHTLYEFAIKISPGNFFIPKLDDPVAILTPQVICDDNGYGVIREPKLYAGNFSKNGTQLTKYTRFIPNGKIAGLEKEPNIITGNIDNGICFKFDSESKNKCYECTEDKHVIDGKFDYLNNEWSSLPAIGRWSNLYAEYCNSILYVLNDWILANYEPDNQSCYNLFELYSGNYKEHWGIFVYHEIEKGMKVFRNGMDVSKDTNYVVKGEYGFGQTSENDIPNAIYEWGLKVQEGDFTLQMADPGPSSFCDDNYLSNPAPRNLENIDILVDNISQNNSSKIELESSDPINISYRVKSLESKKKILGYEIEIVYKNESFNPSINSLKNDFNFTLKNEILEDKPIIGFNTLKISTNEKNLMNGTGELLALDFLPNLKEITNSEIITSIKFYNENANLYNSLDLSLSFKTIISSIKTNDFKDITVYPTITSDIVNISYTSEVIGAVNLNLIDNLGKKISDYEFLSGLGDNTFSLVVSDLNSGIYYIVINYNNSTMLLRFIKQ